MTLVNTGKSHYDKDYYKWQIKAGKYCAQQDLWMYEDNIKSNYRVLDFGCGGGFMMQRFHCKEKYGVDINTDARQDAKKNGLKVYEYLDNIPKNVMFDLIISHHALEHVPNPYETLKELKKKLSSGGKIVCLVPIDDWRVEKRYKLHDVNMHLFTWTPQLIGNLFFLSGFKNIQVQIISRAWLPLSRFYYQYIPRSVYNILSWIWSNLIFSRQIRVIATA